MEARCSKAVNHQHLARERRVHLVKQGHAHRFSSFRNATNVRYYPQSRSDRLLDIR